MRPRQIRPEFSLLSCKIRKMLGSFTSHYSYSAVVSQISPRTEACLGISVTHQDEVVRIQADDI